MSKKIFPRLIIYFFIIALFASCATLIGDSKTECKCMYYDSETGTIAADCSITNCSGEKITAIRVNTNAGSNIELNTILFDSTLSVPSFNFKKTLNNEALNRIKNKGISITFYTQRSDVWYSLRASPAALSSNNRIYFTEHQ